jgi:zinc protease
MLRELNVAQSRPASVQDGKRRLRRRPQFGEIMGIPFGGDSAYFLGLYGKYLRDRDSVPADLALHFDELDGRGASLSVIAGRHQLTVSATCLAEDFEAIFELVAEVICRPRFDEAEVETRRAELITAILQDEDDPGAVAVDVLMGRLYPTHPYGRRPRGTTATVRGITRADLVTFHRSWFGPEGTTVVVTGDVTPATVIQVTERWFSPWRAERCAEPPLADVGFASTRDFFVVPMMSKAQADVAYGVIGIRRADPSYYDAWVMNNALGQYALGGRLGDSIRERQGMAYYVYSSLDATLAAGPLMIRAGVSAENVERTLASIDHELALVREGGLTPKEFDESKQYLIGSIPRQLETNAGIPRVGSELRSRPSGVPRGCDVGRRKRRRTTTPRSFEGGRCGCRSVADD